MKNINWKQAGAAIASALALLAALPYTLGDVATIIPPAWKAKVAIISIIAGFLLRTWNSMTQHPNPVPPTP